MPDNEINKLTERVHLLSQKIEREKAAKKAAEKLLEEKSRELYIAKQLVEDSLINIKEKSEQDIALLQFKTYLESILLDFNQLFLQKPISNILLQRLLDDLIGIDEIKASKVRFKSLDQSGKFRSYYAGDKALINADNSISSPLFWSDDNKQIKIIINSGEVILGSLTIVIASPLSWQHTIEKQLLLFCDMISAAHNRQELLARTIEEKQRAESSEQSTRDFVAMINHELRTPLNGLLGSAELMSYTELTPHQQHLLSTMQQSGELLRVIINDLLDFSKMSAGMLQIVEIDFSPKQLCKMIFDIFKQRTEEFGLDFNFNYQNDIPARLTGDPDRIKQLFVNLIGNAIKFTQRGQITVEIQWQDGIFSFSVADTGCGIPADKIDTLFDPFTQVNNTSNRAYEGTGLGLAICKHLIDEMHGELTLTSQLDLGTEFNIKIPLKIAAQNQKLNHVSEVEFPIDSMSVLVVEDSSVNQVLIEMILAKFDIKPTIVNNGLEAIEYLNNHQVDVIFMDCRMPVVDGFEATMRLRNSGYTKPIIALTASTTSTETEQCYQCGMDGIVNKPYQKQEIKNVLITWGKKLNLSEKA
ncbi:MULTISPECIES: hybrid sensor histidine kinase/response regulator [unclassified Shewanella]|uniref:hybrid sensor histidine kinase/response regulator n=1 Tax=unclassified Shewanella TaxID=196818 RepID=UPI001BBA1B8A|nr:MULTISPECIES: ATP-binding protein [unclassified Shewanella]GIU08810.1 hybrid sensor histidine kinase/response regulator [Shewanella sp. MBTL60-112-B1]GIU40739.1 hybrid sensor histidine kinase/response regulator [Shewanella sp. MBTL60-112-B2]